MRALPVPAIQDEAVLLALAASPVAEAGLVGRLTAVLIACYARYRAHNGDPWALSPSPDCSLEVAGLRALYAKEPVPLRFIGRIREETSGACPMCGGLGAGSIDHYLPQRAYPEFAFFSANLVPACARCNSSRQDVYKGDEVGERPVHPYFDVFSHQRVLSIQVVPPYAAPLFIPVCWGLADEQKRCVDWHIAEVIAPAGIANHCRHVWSRLIDKPWEYCGSDPDPLMVRANLLGRADTAAHWWASPNAWDSCFFHGLAVDPQVTQYLSGLVEAAVAMP